MGFRGHYHIYGSFAASRPKRFSRSGSERNKFDPLPAVTVELRVERRIVLEKVLLSEPGRLS